MLVATIAATLIAISLSVASIWVRYHWGWETKKYAKVTGAIGGPIILLVAFFLRGYTPPFQWLGELGIGQTWRWCAYIMLVESFLYPLFNTILRARREHTLLKPAH